MTLEKKDEARAAPGLVAEGAPGEDLAEEVRAEVRRELEAETEAAAPGSACIELREVALAYGENPVLDRISFRVSQGEILCVLGGSGQGKTTILRLILRLQEPDDGQIFVLGTNIVESSEDEVLHLRERMGMVFQGSALFDSLSVHDNVAFPLIEHTELGDEEIRERVREVLTFVDLDPEQVSDLLPADLSGGMRKRVGIARAIAHEPDILLFDEPTSGLDPITTRTINELILKLQREMGVCAVVVTHDMRSAAKIANRLALLLEGEIVFMGTPEEAYATEDEYVRAFLA